MNSNLTPDESSEPANPYAAPSGEELRHPPLPLKLSLPLAIGLLAIIAVAFVFNIGFGIGVLLISAPAYVRAAFSSMQRASRGEQLSTGERIVSFLSSLAVVGLCGIAGGVTFFGTCLATLLAARDMREQTFLAVLLVASSIGFLVAFGVVYWALWPKRRRV